MLADTCRFERIAPAAAHRIAHKLTDRREHAGNCIGIQIGQPR